MKLLARFWREYASKHTRVYLLGALFLLLTNALSALVPKLVQWGIEALEARESALVWAVALLGVGVGTVVVRTLSRTLIFNPGRVVEYDLKRDFFAHLLRLPRAYFESTLSAGELINRGSNDSAAVRGLIGYGSLQLLNVSTTLLITLTQMLIIDPALTLYCALPLGASALILRWAVLEMFGLTRASLSQVGALSDQLLEVYGAAGLVQSFGVEAGVTGRFQAQSDALLSLNERLARISTWGLPVASVMGSLCLVLLIGVGGRAVARGELTLGALTALVVYVGQLVSCVTSLGWLTGALQRGYISLVRTYEVLDAPADAPATPRPLPPCAPEGPRIEVRDLTFTHPKATRPALRAVSFSVAPGEVVGVFGLTGSGKSALLDLLSRTYAPPEGSVWMDGVDISAVAPEEYWARVCYVQQQAFLFSLSVRENITLSAHTDEARLAAALNAACLAGEVSAFPQGVETRVGERGVTLSGGQRQRAALARAFYRQGYQLLLLDDVLSAVDHATESDLIRALYAREPRCTTLIVSHRMSVLERADRVLVFDEGALIAQGTPRALASGEGLYAQAWRAQSDAPPPTEARAPTEAPTP
jgi:ATP-binding cassette subfamily B multidrug efflux pump